ncbi:MAG TPA: tol-pal system protein YbgF [Stellaceae bacterium]|jgi:tol-pal system protein YbgF|nr:tol-pal system protein YbgF [Stellaceae bacterium]
MKKLLIVAALGIALMATAHGAFAQQDQDYDQQPLLDRITRLERDMSALQSQVYRRGDDENAPPAGGGGQLAAGDEVRFEQLSDQMRELTGRVEEVRHDVGTLQTRLDKLSNDVDMRLQALEHPGAAPGTAMNQPPEQQAPETPPPPPRNRTAGPPPGAGGGFNAPPPPPPPGNQTAMAAPDAGMLPNGSPQQQYDYAFGLLRDANYQAAEQALKDFVARYPNSRLSSNAQYWLGETFFVRGRYQAAAAAFAEGYQKYPKGPKAADDLLKLGSSLSQLNRRADACRSFAQLDRDFPIAAANLKAKEADEKRKAGCH